MRDSDLERSRTYEEEGGLLRKREADPPPPFFLLHGMHGSWEGDRKREKGKRDGKERRRSVLQSRLFGPRLICRISSLDFFLRIRIWAADHVGSRRMPFFPGPVFLLSAPDKKGIKHLRRRRQPLPLLGGEKDSEKKEVGPVRFSVWSHPKPNRTRMATQNSGHSYGRKGQ